MAASSAYSGAWCCDADCVYSLQMASNHSRVSFYEEELPSSSSLAFDADDSETKSEDDGEDEDEDERAARRDVLVISDPAPPTAEKEPKSSFQPSKLSTVAFTTNPRSTSAIVARALERAKQNMKEDGNKMSTAMALRNKPVRSRSALIARALERAKNTKKDEGEGSSETSIKFGNKPGQRSRSALIARALERAKKKSANEEEDFVFSLQAASTRSMRSSFSEEGSSSEEESTVSEDGTDSWTDSDNEEEEEEANPPVERAALLPPTEKRAEPSPQLKHKMSQTQVNDGQRRNESLGAEALDRSEKRDDADAQQGEEEATSPSMTDLVAKALAEAKWKKKEEEEEEDKDDFVLD